jgi:DNA-binding MarR family transcriptional regulator
MKIRKGGFLISKIHQLQGRVFAQKLKNYNVEDLNPSQGRILFVLWQDDGIPIAEVAHRTGLKKQTLTSMLDRLEQSGYITTSENKVDRRQTLVFLTDKYKKLQDTYEKVSQEMTDIYYQGISQEDIDRFEETLEHVLNNLYNADK